jgi:hypothetical protein
MEEFNHEKIAYHLGGIHAELKGINAHLGKVNGRLDKHDTELGTLKSWKDNLKGKVSVVSAIVGILASVGVTILSKVIDKLFS